MYSLIFWGYLIFSLSNTYLTVGSILLSIFWAFSLAYVLVPGVIMLIVVIISKMEGL